MSGFHIGVIGYFLLFTVHEAIQNSYVFPVVKVICLASILIQSLTRVFMKCRQTFRKNFHEICKRELYFFSSLPKQLPLCTSKLFLLQIIDSLKSSVWLKTICDLKFDIEAPVYMLSALPVRNKRKYLKSATYN